MARPAPVLRRVGVGVVLFLLGLVIGVATTLVHPVTWALAVGLLTTVVTAYAVPGGWGTRLPFGLGWVAAVVYFSTPRDEGDFLIASNAHGYVLLGSALLLVIASIVTVRPLRGPPSLDSAP